EILREHLSRRKALTAQLLTQPGRQRSSENAGIGLVIFSRRDGKGVGFEIEEGRLPHTRCRSTCRNDSRRDSDGRPEAGQDGPLHSSMPGIVDNRSTKKRTGQALRPARSRSRCPLPVFLYSVL